MLDTDLDDYLTEYRLQAPAEPITHYEGKCHIQFLFCCIRIIGFSYNGYFVITTLYIIA